MGQTEELARIFAKLKEHFTHNFEVCEAILAFMRHEEPKECERLFVVDVFAIDAVYLRLVGYHWKHIGGSGLDILEKIIVYQRRIFNEVSVTWNALHGNRDQPSLAEYLMKILEELKKEKQRFDEQWDVLSKAAIETIKLVKHGR